MSLAFIAPLHRDKLRLHGWLLLLWSLSAGLLANAMLFYVLQVHSMAVRYAVVAGSLYFFGFLSGGWLYAKWGIRQKIAPESMPVHAHHNDVVAYREEEEALNKKFGSFSFMDGGIGGGDDPISAIFAIIGACILAVFLIFLLWHLPFLATEALAGYLAEVVIEFVIGAVILRRVVPPKEFSTYWGVMFKKSGLTGLFLIVIFGAAGWFLQLLNPGAITFFQVLHPV